MKITDTIGTVLKHKESREILAIAPDQSVHEALEKMSRHNVGALLVLNSGKLVGIFSERDLVRLLAQDGPGAMQRPLQAVMTHNVVTCRAEDRIDDILRLMTINKVRHVPVTEAGRLAGIVSIGDLVNHRLTEKQQEAEVLLEISRMRA